MRPDENIKKLITDLKINPSAELDARVNSSIDNALAERNQFDSTSYRPGTWRIVMRSPITKLAAAAVIIIAVLAGIYYFAGEGTRKCCAWERIADRVEQFKTCIFRMHIQQMGGPFGQKGQQIESKVYLSSDYGYKMETMLEGKVMQQMYMPADDNAMVMVMPSEKKYMRMVLTDEMRTKSKKQMQDPRTMVTQMVSGMSGQYKELGKEKINGVEVQGIEVNNPPGFQGVYNNFMGRLWVDVDTEYPVRMEIEAEIGTGEQKINMVMVMDGFEWSAELSPDLFKPDIPADYTMMAEMKMPGQDEASAIEGLRLFAEMTDGNYPSQMNVMTLTRETAEIFGKKFGANKTKPSDEQVQEMTAKAMKVQAPVLFYAKLGQDGKGPVYYGKGVKAGDANAVLMRWKNSDDTYRVIYGDLSAESVTDEKLKEMEQASQQ
jgi:outer membrane lipoprotein-sorting protein